MSNPHTALTQSGTSQPAQQEALLGATFTPEQSDALLATLPSMQPEVDQIVRQMLTWDRMPVGLAADGTFHQAVETVLPAHVWVDRELYVYGEHQEGEPDRETMEALIASFEARQVRTATGVIEQFVWSPLLVVRRSNPANRDQTLMLVRGMDALLVARAVGWPGIEAIVYPEMSDDAIRSIGLHLAFRESRPQVWEALRHIFPLELAANEFVRRRGRPKAGESHMTDETLARIIGCDRSYITRLRRFWMTPTLREMVAHGRMSLRVALKSVDILGRFPEVQEAVVGYISQHQLPPDEAEAYMKTQASLARANSGSMSSPPQHTRQADWTRSNAAALAGPPMSQRALPVGPSTAIAPTSASSGAPQSAPETMPYSQAASAVAFLQERANALWDALEGFVDAVGPVDARGRAARIVTLLEEAVGEMNTFIQEQEQLQSGAIVEGSVGHR